MTGDREEEAQEMKRIDRAERRARGERGEQCLPTEAAKQARAE